MCFQNKPLELSDSTLKLVETRRKSSSEKYSEDKKSTDADRKQPSTNTTGKKDPNQSKPTTKKPISKQKCQTLSDKNKRQNIIRKSKLYHGQNVFQKSRLRRLVPKKRSLPQRRSSARIQELTTALRSRQRRQPPCYIMSDSEDGELFDDEDKKDETFVVPGKVIETTKMTITTRSRQEKPTSSNEDSSSSEKAVVKQKMDTVKKVEKVSSQRDQLKLSKIIERRRKLRNDSSGSSTNESPTKRARKSSGTNVLYTRFWLSVDI